MDTIVNISQFLLSLSLLIILHEMGHFLPAKWFKTRVEKFFLFFDFAPFNALFSFKRGETEYGIGWLPLGGYVKISGMVDESMDTESLNAPPQPWEFRSKPAWQRLIIMLGGVTVNFLLGFFLFAMILWNWGKAYYPNDGLQYGIAYDSLMIKQGFQQGDIIMQIGDEPVDRINEGAFREAVVLHDVRTITVKRNGQNQQISIPERSVQDFAKHRTSLMQPRLPFVVEEVASGKPADLAGLQKGDRVIAINGNTVEYYDQFTPIAQQNKSKEVNMTLLRGADTINTKITLSSAGLIGVQMKTEGFYAIGRQKYSLAEAFPGGVHEGMGFLNTQLSAFGKMISGQLNVNENLGSLISIGKMYGTTWNWERFWTLTASLSILLAFMNLLPIPALDGGYVLFLLWEVVTGRKVSDKFMEKAVTFGFFLLIGLMIYAFGLDIWRHFIQKLF